jgi:hypothetical protein
VMTRSDVAVSGTHTRGPDRHIESLFTSISRGRMAQSPGAISRDRSFTHGWAAEAVKPSTISTAQLHRLPGFHMPPIKQVFSLRSYPVDPVGNLILRRASHLDAFSAYPNRTWLPSDALGRTTGTPEVRPLRSSRTRSSSSQVPYAHDG